MHARGQAARHLHVAVHAVPGVLTGFHAAPSTGARLSSTSSIWQRSLVAGNRHSASYAGTALPSLSAGASKGRGLRVPALHPSPLLQCWLRMEYRMRQVLARLGQPLFIAKMVCRLHGQVAVNVES
jgi:hypothetical protein